MATKKKAAKKREPGQEVWEPAGAVSTVRVVINGEQAGEAGQHETIGDVAKRFAQAHGLRRFSVVTDGQKRTTAAGDTLLTRVRTLELVAKDAQG
jgi:hypothetical protein